MQIRESHSHQWSLAIFAASKFKGTNCQRNVNPVQVYILHERVTATAVRHGAMAVTSNHD